MNFGRVALLLCALILMAPLAVAEDEPDPRLRELLRAAASDTSSFTDRFDGEVWLHDMSNRLAGQVDDMEERIEILRAVHDEAHRADLPPELVLAVIDIESNFDRFAVSHAGARGLMQVMPFWLEDIGRPNDNLLHIRTNLRMGCTILQFYIEKENGNYQRALGRYNGSLGKTQYPNKVLDRLRNKWYRL